MRRVLAAFALLAAGCTSSGDVAPVSTEELLVTGFSGLPADARLVADRLASCHHFWGEPADDWPERRAEIDKALAELRCETVIEDARRIRTKYEGDRAVQDALDRAGGL